MVFFVALSIAFGMIGACPKNRGTLDLRCNVSDGGGFQRQGQGAGNRNEVSHWKSSRRGNAAALLAALKAASRARDIERGRQAHLEAIHGGLDSSVFVASSLIDMYAKCGRMEEARAVFDGILHRDVVSWSSIILGYAQNGQGEVALELFVEMQRAKAEDPSSPQAPNSQTFVAAIRACSSMIDEKKEGKVREDRMACLEKGMAIHARARLGGLDTDGFVACSLVDFYAKCGSMVTACWVFDRVDDRSYSDLVLWTALISGYAHNGDGDIALEIFEQASAFFDASSSSSSSSQSYSTRTIFLAAVKACTSIAAKEEVTDKHRLDRSDANKFLKAVSLEKGMAVHSAAARLGYITAADIFLMSCLVDFYAKCGSMVDSQRVFDSMSRHDVVSWTALVWGYAHNGQEEIALEVYARLQQQGCASNSQTFVAALKAVVCLAEAEVGKEIDGKVVKVTALEKGMAIHSQAASSGKQHHTETFVANSLIDMYSKCGSMVDALRSLEAMASPPDIISWTALILGYADAGEGNRALEIFSRMQSQGCRPNAHTFVAALKACGSISAVGTGRVIHGEICKFGLETTLTAGNSLVDFYGKSGSMVRARQVFDCIPALDVASWTSLMAGYCHQGEAMAVLDLFVGMVDQGVNPNEITLVTVLTACSHAGLVHRGKRYFSDMKERFGLTPRIDHYHCLIDLLGRANLLEEALQVAKAMPMEATSVTWTIVLVACEKWKNIEVAKIAFEALVVLDENQAGSYVLMANVYRQLRPFVVSSGGNKTIKL
ncbi:pentatricopeptide repeat-containing protein At2g13600-like [Selaginella moellendorffii]|uniref:pentatricopeptide repeat-containing protein At2g13600-like n=1 Tax=Selaginella moellendorffii TaxID=88036 RepID=UPI000D1CBF25|nr:pentatricopeptide repeat-containing protein At2g13600-like [Selaginella moellendorffii]|eukprot:XP_024542630.1 pentatricopeptide repeat-containing protein At2g13600-like [Selaginella moellendorffii]